MHVLVLVQNVDQELDVVHILDAERFTDGVDLDFQLLLGISAHAPLHSLVVNQEGRLVDQETEDLLHALILLASRVLVLRGDALVVDELTLGLSLSVIAALRVHNRRILVHE